MPSKIRYILFTPKQVFHGSQVVAMLCKLARNNLFNLSLPKDWALYSTQRKLEFLAQLLPNKYRLTIFREPKWTRRKLSRYALALCPSKPMNPKKNILEQSPFAAHNAALHAQGIAVPLPTLPHPEGVAPNDF
jgi:hypothetical protein